MTLPLFSRTRVATPRRRIVEVTNRWVLTPDGSRREVLVREPDGELRRRHLPDEHPALVRYLERAAAVAA